MLAFTADSLLPLAMITLAMVVGFVTLRRAHRRAQEPTAAQRLLAQTQSDHRAGVERQQVSGLMVELEEFARRMNAQIDTKAARLECLIRDADERLARLEHTHTADERPARPKQTRDSAPTPRPHPAEDADGPRRRLTPRTVSRSASTAAPPPPGPHSAEICALADEGRRPLEIAQRLQLAIGEVELILRLRELAAKAVDRSDDTESSA